ncbi:hypothetical protein TWF481_011700 [Arthrobotrys musiformis]|uniref:Uncharacterized protein n=1 Tax=Arthrobotrys musiformis TaxID=47236 RepID=A0AAV9VZ80_9PEZI
MKRHQIDPYYIALLAEKCLKDYDMINFIIDRGSTVFGTRKYSYEPSRQIDDIHVSMLKVGVPSKGIIGDYSVSATIPSWLYAKYELIPDILRQLRICYTENKDCHGTLEDHIDLFMKKILGPASIVPTTDEDLLWVRGLSSIYIRQTETHLLPLGESGVMRVLLKKDLEVTEGRRKWRAEHKDTMLESIQEDGGTAYVSRQASKLLGSRRNGPESRKRDAEETLYGLGWRKRDMNWRKVYFKVNEALERDIAAWKGKTENEGDTAHEGEKEKEDISSETTSTQQENIAATKAPEAQPAVGTKGRSDDIMKSVERAEKKRKSIPRRIGGGILRFMKIKK